MWAVQYEIIRTVSMYGLYYSILVGLTRARQGIIVSAQYENPANFQGQTHAHYSTEIYITTNNVFYNLAVAATKV